MPLLVGELNEEVKESNLLFISERRKSDFVSMNRHSIEYLFNETKIQLITLHRYKNESFSDYCKEFVLNKELVGKYLVGFETNTLLWLIDCFQQIAQTHNYHSMHNLFCKIVNKFC